MKVEKIEKEINQLKTRLDFLQDCLKEIQQNCEHQYFAKNSYYEQCTECNKVNVLYY